MTSGETSGRLPHEPVMSAQIIDYLRPEPGRTLVDATFGAGGHSRILLEAGADVIAIDQDREAVAHAAALESSQLRFVAGNFRDIDKHLAELGVDAVEGILCDLGVSSMQLDQGERGFAFRQEGPLDMRMGSQEESAADVVNEYPQEELAAIIFRYGDERHSRRIARAIVAARDEEAILTTERLTKVVTSAYPPGYRREHPARRTFQALRIFVNDELGALAQVLEIAPDVLVNGGRLAVLSYHSLEDRIVKHSFRDDPRLEPLTKRPLTATEEELERNPRSRSAKLRVAQKSAQKIAQKKTEWGAA
ncbi:MAG: 16S rRNA (cytosine(1402)-N(4))-methyltransferase RsmH [Trueperaceae bacterium]